MVNRRASLGCWIKCRTNVLNIASNEPHPCLLLCNLKQGVNTKSCLFNKGVSKGNYIEVMSTIPGSTCQKILEIAPGKTVKDSREASS